MIRIQQKNNEMIRFQQKIEMIRFQQRDDQKVATNHKSYYVRQKLQNLRNGLTNSIIGPQYFNIKEPYLGGNFRFTFPPLIIYIYIIIYINKFSENFSTKNLIHIDQIIFCKKLSSFSFSLYGNINARYANCDQKIQ